MSQLPAEIDTKADASINSSQQQSLGLAEAASLIHKITKMKEAASATAAPDSQEQDGASAYAAGSSEQQGLGLAEIASLVTKLGKMTNDAKANSAASDDQQQPGGLGMAEAASLLAKLTKMKNDAKAQPEVATDDAQQQQSLGLAEVASLITKLEKAKNDAKANIPASGDQQQGSGLGLAEAASLITMLEKAKNDARANAPVSGDQQPSLGMAEAANLISKINKLKGASAAAEAAAAADPSSSTDGQGAKPGLAAVSALLSKVTAKRAASSWDGARGQELLIDAAAVAGAAPAALAFSNCVGCKYTVDAPCAKVFLRNCEDTVVTLSKGCQLLTQTVEVTHCRSTTVNVHTRVCTLQVEQCAGVTVHVHAEEHFGNGAMMLNGRDVENDAMFIWAGCDDLRLHIGEQEHSFDFAAELSADRGLSRGESQFKVHYDKGALVSDKIIRLPNGFPSTQREQDEFIRQTASSGGGSAFPGVTIKRKTSPAEFTAITEDDEDEGEIGALV